MMVLNVQYSSRQTTHGVQKLSPISSPRASPSRLQIRPASSLLMKQGWQHQHKFNRQHSVVHIIIQQYRRDSRTQGAHRNTSGTSRRNNRFCDLPTRRYDRDLPPLDHESTRNATVRSFRLREPRIASYCSCSSSCSRRSRPLSSNATPWLRSTLLDI